MPVGRTHGRRVAAACAAALALPLFLAACGDSDNADSTGTSASTGAAAASTTAAPKETQEVSLQLDWTPNTNHTGFYVADKKGYYADAGIKLKILPYSDAGADTIVGAGKANCGITSQDNLPVASSAGTNEVSVMPILQHQANVLIVKDDSKFQSPKDLSGAKYGGFGLPFEQPLVDAMIKNDGGTGDIKNVILNTGAYEAVYNGKVDTSLAFKTWEMIEADERGIKLRTFYPNDYGVPDTYNVLLACNGDWLKDNPELAKAFVNATAKGFTDAMKDPKGAAQILIDANPGVFSNTKMVFTSADLLAKDYYPDESGVFGCQTDARWQAYPKWLYEQGILKDQAGKALSAPPDYSTFYSNDYAPDDCGGGAA